MTNPFLERLQQGPIIGDGAMGTMLHSSGVPHDSAFDVLNLSNPDLVASIHRAYIAAGAEIIETNSYGANRFKLEQLGLGGKVRQLNRVAAKIAREQREISGRSVFVAGSIGPTLQRLPPIGKASAEKVRAAFREQIEALLEGGVDLLTIETIPDISEMREAIAAARECSDLPIIAMLTFAEDGRTVAGNEAAAVVEMLLEHDVDVIGANCSVGPQRLLQVVDAYERELDRRGVSLPLACIPNAGWPTQQGGRMIYPSSPDYFAKFALQAADAGVTVIGGCCGTTPAHIEAMARAMLERATGEIQERPPVVSELVVAEIAQPAASGIQHQPDGFRTELGRKFLVAVEIDPPKGLNPEKALVGAELLKRAGVDAINVADSPMARVRMSALTLCMMIQHQVDVETIVHFTTRDRSLMGIQSELLGAHAAGVRTVLALTGDPPTLGGYPGTTGVYDTDSIGLIKLLTNMNEGVDAVGAPIGSRADFRIGCAVDPTRQDLALEAERLHAKLEAGAHFVMTQPIFDASVWTEFLAFFGGPIPVPLMIGILPLQSAKHADFLHNEVPGITLTEDALRRMHAAGPDGRREGVRMAQELLLDLMPIAQGVYLMPSFGRYEVAAEVLDVLEPAHGRELEFIAAG
ncbi:MAG TPA: bifunctional homocysteine S-methyltransferase/methylenetetrahydrofolate reductase [Thermomicrobiales bacterium]|nr:bifunctional homocysteine S-methyltransferase/methylenetetrahydrofolate reductase [Thermomicrobiales bacterium]